MRNLSQSRVDQRGFTLAELLVAIAIIGLIMTGLLTLLMKGNETYLAGSNQVEAQATIRAALERMTQEIREGGYNPVGLPPCTPPTVPPACMDAVVNATATSFTIQNDWNASGAVDPAPTTVCIPYSWAVCPAAAGAPNLRGEQITYSIVGGALCRQESGIAAPASPPCPAGSQTLATNVAQAAVGLDCAGALIALPAVFLFCDGSGNALGFPILNPSANQANIRTVVVNLQVGVQNQAAGSWQTGGAVQVTMTDLIRLRNRVP